MPKTLQATVALFIIACMWGLTFPFIGIAIQTMSPSAFVVCRLLVAMLCFFTNFIL